MAAEPAASPSGVPGRSRLVSLDALRGFVIAGMLLVNNVVWSQATPRQLMHAAWNQGVTFTDMIFPWFLFAMGVAIPFASRSHREKRVSPAAYAFRVARRTGILILLGLVVDSSVYRRPVLAMGVLQLLGLAYLAGALTWGLRGWIRAALAAFLLIGHWALIEFVPIPGVGAGIFQEDRNIIRYLNQTYLAPYHLAGIISIVPTSALVIIGTLIGDLLRSPKVSSGVKPWIVSAIGAALALAGWSWQWDLPLNKPVWTASYVLLAAGLGAILLALAYVAFDMLNVRALAFPFVVFGANAIIVYVASILFKIHVLQAGHYRSGGETMISFQQAILDYLARNVGPVLGGWIYTGAFILLWWLVLLFLYRRRIFVRV